MGEAHRTLLGHFRHESGHYYWDRLVRSDSSKLDAFRSIFGDERQDYANALQKHYKLGGPTDWQDRFVTAYASAHPWEDFAETWAHYLHIADTLETASTFGLAMHPRHPQTDQLSVAIDFEPRDTDLARLIDAWLPLTFAVNSINRSMGLPDLYPFVLSPQIIIKLAFIHEQIHPKRAAQDGNGAIRAVIAGLRRAFPRSPVGSVSPLGHSISNHSSGRRSGSQSSRCATQTRGEQIATAAARPSPYAIWIVRQARFGRLSAGALDRDRPRRAARYAGPAEPVSWRPVSTYLGGSRGRHDRRRHPRAQFSASHRHSINAGHAYGPACYRPGACAEIIELVAQRIDAREFNRNYPQTFPRLV